MSPAAGASVVAFLGITSLATILTDRLAIRPGMRARTLGAASARDLAAFRIAVAAILLGSVAIDDLAGTAALPRALFVPNGVIDGLLALPIGTRTLLTSPALLTAWRVATALALLAVLVGWRAPWSLIAAATLYAVFGGILRCYTTAYHTGLVPLHVLIVLAATPCTDAWSVARARPPRGPADASTEARYAWGRLACWMAITLPYVAAGLSKVRNGGLAWFDPTNLRHVFCATTLNPMHFAFTLGLVAARLPDAVLTGTAAGVVALQIGYGAFIPWPRARRILPVAAIGFHVITLLFQNLLFLDLIVLQLVMLRRWRPLRSLVPLPTWRVRGLPALVLGLWVATWVGRVERFPLSAMQMFSWAHHTPVVIHHDVTVVRRSGAEGGTDAILPCGFRSLPLRGFVAGLFDPPRRPSAMALLRHCAAEANRRRPSDPIVTIRVERYRWDVDAAPLDPSHGALVATTSIDLGNHP